jgi:hypothetical protein
MHHNFNLTKGIQQIRSEKKVPPREIQVKAYVVKMAFYFLGKLNSEICYIAILVISNKKKKTVERYIPFWSA